MCISTEIHKKSDQIIAARLWQNTIMFELVTTAQCERKEYT